MSVTAQLDFNSLPKYQKRKFVPEDVNFGNASEVTALFEKLLQREIPSSLELQQWVLDRSDLDAALQQYGSIIYIKMTCQTDNADYARAYSDFIQNVMAAVKPLYHKLNQKYLEAVKKIPLDSHRYEVYNRDLRTDVELFREENVALETQLKLLSQEYQKICGAMTVTFEGKEQTLPQMSKYLLEPKRTLRESAWRAVSERRLKDKDKLENLFDQMLVLRSKIATNADYSNFRDYQFKAYHRFDYSPQDCKQYHVTVEKVVLPLWKKILQKRCREMQLEKLRPWDTEVDALGRPALKPFDDVNQLIKKTEEIFNQTDPELNRQFAEMRSMGLLDLASRKGKAPGGYQCSLVESRKPFIFMNAVGVDSDVRTLLHESGHAFHALACAEDPILEYRHAPMEFCEVASMGMELLASEHLSVFYKSEDFKRSQDEHFEGVIFILIWVAIIDAFQHWIYENPTHTPAERKEAWRNISNRFTTGLIDWQGLEESFAYLWHRQLHIFEVPFYYIEYGIAQLGALQLWLQAKKNSRAALQNYKRALKLGGSRPLPELFQACGLEFDFSEATIGPVVNAVKAELVI